MVSTCYTVMLVRGRCLLDGDACYKVIAGHYHAADWKRYMFTKLMHVVWCLIVWFPSLSVYAADKWLIAPQMEVFHTGQKISLDVVKPDDVSVWPERIYLNLSGTGSAEVVAFTRAPPLTGVARQLYTGIPKAIFIGVVRAELVDYESNRALLLAASTNDLAPLEIAATTNASSKSEAPVAGTTKVVLAAPGDEPPLTANEPLYFLVGSSSERDFDARYQLSFKYRPFDPSASTAQYFPMLSNVYFAYTQTSLWDLGGDSSPFKDTSYRPSLYYKWAGAGRGIVPDGWTAGVEHESNGRDEDDSRSINIAFVRPSWHFDFSSGRRLTLSPKIYQYLEKSDNPDIEAYRGYADFQARYGREDGAIITALYRHGTHGKSFGQLDLSYPISDKLFGRTGTFIHLQLLEGYGETLIDYNRYSEPQLRIGLSLAR